MGAASCFSGSTFRLVNGSDSHPLVTRILVVRFSSMGDVILTTPVVRALHAMLEGDVEVHFLTKSPFAAAVRNLEGVSRVWTMERTTAEVEDDLKAVGFHYVVDLHANARSGFVKRALRADGGRTFDLTVNKRSLDKILLVRTGWDRLAGQHVVERYLATLRPFGDARAALARVGDDASLQLPLRPSEGKKEGVVLALGAAHVGKSIPESHWRGIVKGLRSQGEQVTLIGGPDERELAERLCAAEDGVRSLCGQASWADTFSMMSTAEVLVGGDTGAMHAGAALKVPMVVIWGCTSPALGMGPWNPHSKTVQLEPESPNRSRPCSRLGDRCRHKTPCIQRVPVQKILAGIEGILNRKAP
jgi:ADP-heptose:LPS heptosyltransferase